MSDVEGFGRRTKGLSEVAFQEAYGREEQCRAALFAWRWSKGWSCPSCVHGGHCYLKKRGKLQCNSCKHQASVTAGTIFHSTKLPLKVWFLAIYHISQSKGGISSAELGRRLGVREATAWLMKQKIMAAMQTREEVKPKLKGRIEMDDAYLGGARSGGKRGRGAAGKTPFIAAVETTIERRPRRIKLKTVKGFRKKEVERFAKAEIEPRSSAVSDGLSCWPAVTKADVDHFPMRTGSGRQAAQWVPFKWVNTVLGNIKTAITGTYHHVSPKHAERYLASFAYRFNRRYDLDTITQRLTWACTQTKPHPYRIITAG